MNRKHEIRRARPNVVDLARSLFDEMARQEAESDPRVESREWTPDEPETHVDENGLWKD